MSARDRYIEALITADEIVREMPERAPDDPTGVESETKAALRVALADAVRRARDGDVTPGSATAASLSRRLVDGNGTRDPSATIYSALEAIDAAREEAVSGALQLLPPATLQSLAESGPTVPPSYLPLIVRFALLVPTTTDADRNTRLVSLQSTGGLRMIPAFASRGQLDRWSAQARADSTSVSLTQIETLLQLAQRAQVDGIVIDPGGRNVVIPIDKSPLLETHDARLPARVPLSFGGAANVSPELVAAARRAAQNTPGVSAVYAVSVVEGTATPRLVWVVKNDAADQTALRAFANHFVASVPSGSPIDILDADTPLGQAVQESVSPVYRDEQG
ncbi:SseB family protein [Microbacterium sp. cx-55]|uniref:SseB family protein n=1 Tax=unclassified Microbacterium TaxID=2609290 RepID=UPI001CBF790B|nr:MULTISPECIES: enhanced serine sensitivity protein SseB C-terminal domain-containing protein [unclassified Microbacterium]MBZ4488280.1 SseB family protein [Microbacterium sp. cx-55]MCC4909340.1 SseB family protein [Microbacterium sp. cx-59]UGB34941.1 SseB family protein [Microbacterium sp. cx-55]